MKERRSVSVIHAISLLLLVVLLVLTPFCLFLGGTAKEISGLILCSFWLNGALWSLLLVREVMRRSFSLVMMHWAFCLLFFFYAAMAQYTCGSFPWVGKRTDEILLRTNYLLLFWSVLFFLGSLCRERRRRCWIVSLSVSEWGNFAKWIPFLTAVSAANMIFRICSVGVIQLLSRSTSLVLYSNESSVTLFVGKVVQSLAYFSAVFALISWKKHKIGIPWVVVNVICLCLSYFPTGVARHAAAAIYLGLFLTYSRRAKTARWFVLLLFCACILVLPFLNAFRHASFSDVSIANVYSDASMLWLSGDYDAYTMMTLMVEYAGEKGITWGRQLLGALLFWVPRSVWAQKPTGSGYFVAEEMGLSFNNVCCPLPGEAMINFGVIGLVVVGFAVGYAAAKIDDMYWFTLDISARRIRCIDMVYPASCVMFFFMCRGDLMSSLAYMAALVIPWLVMVILSRFKVGRGYIHFRRGIL